MEATMIRPQVKVEKLEGLDPEFEGGSTHTATATLTNPTAKQFTYTTELYFDVTKVASSGTGSITIPAGASQAMDYTIIVPIVEGEYEPFLDVFCVDAITAENPTGLVAHYKAVENVVIAISPVIEVGPITWV